MAQFQRNEIHAVTTQRVATKDAPERQPPATPEPVTFHSLDRIGRATWDEPAWRGTARSYDLVKADEPKADSLRPLHRRRPRRGLTLTLLRPGSFDLGGNHAGFPTPSAERAEWAEADMAAATAPASSP